MKFFSVVLFIFLSFECFSQTSLKKITIAANPIALSGFVDKEHLAEKVESALTILFDSLSREYAFDFNGIDKGAKGDIIISATIAYKVLPNFAETQLFRYNLEVDFKELKTDSVIAKVALLYKDLINIPVEILVSEGFSTYRKVFSKIILPVATPLIPAATESADCLCLTIKQTFNFQQRSIAELAKTLTYIYSNALSFHQGNYSYQYYNEYESGLRAKRPKSCQVIKGSLRKNGDDYHLTMRYGIRSMNLTSPRHVEKDFIFNGDRINEADYYEVIRRINKSVYSFLENNTMK
jgi:hypothetical protein